jgi:hypothetical protein
MAQAVQRMNRISNMQDGVSDTIQYFLDRLYTSRHRPPPSSLFFFIPSDLSS